MRKVSPFSLLLVLAAAAFTLGTVLQPRAATWQRPDDAKGNALQAFLGNGRRLFANHFFTKADVSFHGGYYPSIFDRSPARKDKSHLTQKDAHEETGTNAVSEAAHEHDAHGHTDEDHQHSESQHEKDFAFLGPPRDWIEKFGRHFQITEHKHLEGQTEREILPWLRVSAELDPDQPETYMVAAYWLRDMGKVQEAEKFLREGLRNIPDSYELYFEMGRLYFENYKDHQRARNLWEVALRKYAEAEKAGKNPDRMMLDQIAVHLAKVEEDDGNLERAIALLKIAETVAPNPANIRSRIVELQQKLANPKPPGQ